MSRTASRPRTGSGSPRLSPAALMADCLVLLLLLAGLFHFALQTYLLPGEPGVVLAGCLLFGLLSLTVWSLPGRARLAALAGAVLLGTAALWLLRERLAAGGLLVLRAAVDCWNEATGILLPLPPAADLMPWERLSAANCFLLFAAALLALLLGWAVVRRRGFLPCFLLTLPWLLPALLAEVPLDWPALAVISACWMARLLGGLSRQARPSDGAAVTLAAFPIALLALAGTLLLFPGGDYQPPAWATAARAELLQTGEELFGTVFPGEGGSGTAAAVTTGTESEVNLAQAGPRSYSGVDLLRVECDVPGPLYLRAGSYSDYTGESWLRGVANSGSLYDLSVLFPARGAQASGAQAHFLTVTHLQDEARDLLAPYQFSGVFSGAGSPLDSAPAPVLWSVVQDSVLRVQGEDQSSYSFAYYPLDGDPLPVSASGDGPAQSETERYADLEEDYRWDAYSNYLDVPDETAEYLRAWRAEAEADLEAPAGDGSLYGDILGQAARVARLLGENTRYDLQTPRMEEGEDFVIHFLEEGRGYCMHYASTAAMLLRLEGIPARYVQGYLVQVPDSGSATVSDSAAHAWVEVYLDGYGWYPVEVTPPDGTGGQDLVLPEPEETVPAETETPSPQPTDTTRPEETAQPGGEEGEHGGSGPLPVLLAAGAVLVLLVLSAAALRLIRGWQWRRLFRRPDRNRAVIDAYGWFQRLASWGVQPGEAVLAAVQKARFSQHTLTRAERAAVLAQLTQCIRDTAAALPPIRAVLFRFLFQFPAP